MRLKMESSNLVLQVSPLELKLLKTFSQGKQQLMLMMRKFVRCTSKLMETSHLGNKKIVAINGTSTNLSIVLVMENSVSLTELQCQFIKSALKILSLRQL
jgi:predicted ThiF/HesA family dinucleotide-utilizing enzyme